MANPRIEVEIGAKVEGLSAGVNTATGQLDKLGKAAQATAPQVQKLTQATQGYNSVGVDFARIVQDAPFGIIGIGNNITQLAGSFQTLKNTTGSTSAALKASFASIFSSGNALVLGISVLTTAFTILQQKGFFKSEEAAKSLNEELDDYRENLDAISQASIKGQANAAKEIQNFKLLQVQAENTNIPLNKRIEAVNELQKNYPDYLGNLTQEQILNGNVGESYKLLSESIIAKAKAQAFSNAISENALKIATFENQIIEKQVELEKARAAVLTASTASAATGGIGQPIFSEKAIAEAKVNDILKEQENIRNQISKVQKEDEDLTRRIVDLTSQGASFTKTKTEETKKTVKESENLKRTFEDLSKIDPFVNFANLERGGSFFEGVEKQLTSLESGVAATRGIYQQNISAITQSNQALVDSLSGSGITVEEFYAAIANGAAEGFDNLGAFINRIADTRVLIQNTFDLLIANANEAFSDLGTSIGEALATGTNVLSAVGKSLLSSVGKLLGDFGKQLIAFGVAGLAYSSLIKSIFTDPITAAPKAGLAIAAGVALVAISGAIGASMRSNASGGGGGGGSSVGSSGVGGGTSFAGGGAQGGLFAQNRDVSGEFVVRGQDLVYVLGQANNRINKG